MKTQKDSPTKTKDTRDRIIRYLLDSGTVRVNPETGETLRRHSVTGQISRLVFQLTPRKSRPGLTVWRTTLPAELQNLFADDKYKIDALRLVWLAAGRELDPTDVVSPIDPEGPCRIDNLFRKTAKDLAEERGRNIRTAQHLMCFRKREKAQKACEKRSPREAPSTNGRHASAGRSFLEGHTTMPATMPVETPKKNSLTVPLKAIVAHPETPIPADKPVVPPAARQYLVTRDCPQCGSQTRVFAEFAFGDETARLHYVTEGGELTALYRDSLHAIASHADGVTAADPRDMAARAIAEAERLFG